MLQGGKEVFGGQIRKVTCMAGNRKTKSNIAGFLLKKHTYINGWNGDGCAQPFIRNHIKVCIFILLFLTILILCTRQDERTIINPPKFEQILNKQGVKIREARAAFFQPTLFHGLVAVDCEDP